MTVTEDPLKVEDPGPGALDGAGVIAGARDLANSHGLAEGAANAVAEGISALGVIKDPFESALSAGVGWLIDHLWFLEEPLDALAGNPAAITAHAQTWRNIAQQLATSAEQRTSGIGALQSWQGPSRDGYQDLATKQADAILRSALHADELSRQVLGAGAAVGTVRSLIRDLIAKFVAKAVERALLALAGAAETLGATVAAFIADMVAEGTILAGKIAGKIAELVTALGRSSAAVTALAGKVDDLVAGLGRAGQAAKATLPDAAGDSVHATADQAKSLLPEKMRDWAANPPQGLRAVARESVTRSKDDILTSLEDPRDWFAQKAVPEVWKQDAKAEETKSDWTPL